MLDCSRNGLVPGGAAPTIKRGIHLFDSNWLPALILLVAFIALFVDLYRQSNLTGRAKHRYRHVPKHMRQAGSLNTGKYPKFSP